MELNNANKYIKSFVNVIGKINNDFEKDGLRVGIDLGTANICMAVIDKNNIPVTGEIQSASAVKDGLIVDYMGAVGILRTMKATIEERIGLELTSSAVAVPPGTIGKNSNAFENIIETLEMKVSNIIDEPEAASLALGIKNGAVVDVGGGTTGVSILKNGQVVSSYDEATGGTHMSLVLAGNKKISFEEAEKIKLDITRQKEVFFIIKPVIEKMASITKKCIDNHDVEAIYIVGGASSFDGFEDIFYKECKIKTFKPENSLFVTPLGIALSSTN